VLVATLSGYLAAKRPGASRDSPRVQHPRLSTQAGRDPADRRASVHAARRTLVRTVALAAATAAVIVIGKDGQAAWICVPAALLAAGAARGRAAGAVAAIAVAGAAVGADLLAAGTRTRPSVALLVLIAAASVAILLAVRDRVARERDALRASALTDPLTGAANRRSLLARIEYEMARHARSRRSFALLMLDLDGFKLLNDRFGHPAGDDLLREVAAALARVVRDQDTVARVGGDEFCVLAPETDETGAQRLISRVEAAVARVTAGADSLGASAGAAVFPRDGETAERLLQAADQHLLASKRQSQTARTGRRVA
jgi:diguanylate cyclase (GGDEF)-like protein